MATREATFAYRGRFGDAYARTFFRRAGDPIVSSIGAGTYRGAPTDAVDDAYEAALGLALEHGCNVVDTAINYRHQRSERAAGRALGEASVDREEVFLATKGGFVPFDGERPDSPGQHVYREYVDAGLVDEADLVAGSHCIAPAFLADQLDRSLSNLGVESVDCYYVHNPEVQLDERPPDAVYDRLEEAFTLLERRAAAGDLGTYGVATWEAFRVPEDHERYLSMAEVVSRARRAAREAGNDATHFGAIQLPFNVLMADAFTVESQPGPERPQSALRFAHEAGVSAFASVPLAGGDLLGEIPPAVDERLTGETAAQRALNFARSAPGVTCALVGTTDAEHVRENLAAGTFEPMGADAFDAVFE